MVYILWDAEGHCHFCWNELAWSWYKSGRGYARVEGYYSSLRWHNLTRLCCLGPTGMIHADVIVARFDEGPTPTVTDRFATGFKEPTLDTELGGTNNLISYSYAAAVIVALLRESRSLSREHSCAL